METFVLNKNQTHAFVECKCLGISTNEHFIDFELSSTQNWESSIHILSYFLAIVLERKKKLGYNVAEIINDIYILKEEYPLEIQNFDRNFIEYMLKQVNNETNDLEKTLIELQKKYIEYDYSEIIHM